LIHDLIKPRKFNCVAAVSRGIYQIRRGIYQIFLRKTVGPSDYTVSTNLRGKTSL